MMDDSSQKLWGGSFSNETDVDVEQFTASVEFDSRLYRYDIAGSIAHARMLAKIGVLSDSEFKSIQDGLNTILTQIESGVFNWAQSLEDVHMNIEKRLTDDIGEAGRKLHSARSRNDQAVTDLRLYLRDAVDHIISLLAEFENTLIGIAEREASTIMPGYTHLQIAQPITLGHHLMAWFEMLERDRQRFIDAHARINQSPLGAAALAGTSFPIDREMTAKELGFRGVLRNSLDAVSDRDFALETAANSAICMIHLSRIGEELVHWASAAYRFISIPDEFTTGSSIMPQKKNPDVAEIVRGKSARTAGDLHTLLMLMKSQPLAYNRDSQEDKEPLFDSIDTVTACIKIMHRMIANLEFNRNRLRQAAADGFSTATDLADYLVLKNVPFRDAHRIVGQIVRYCVDNNRNLDSLSADEMQSFHPSLDNKALQAITPEASVAARNHIGGTAPEQVLKSVEEARQRLACNRNS